MRKDSNFGILLSVLLFLAGIYLLYRSITGTQWYVEIYVVAGATMSTFGLLLVFWPIHRRLAVRRPGHLVRHR